VTNSATFVPSTQEIEVAVNVLGWAHQLIVNKLTPAHVRAQVAETQDDRTHETIARIDADVKYYERLTEKATEMIKTAWEFSQ